MPLACSSFYTPRSPLVQIIIDLRPSTAEEAQVGAPGESSAGFGGIADSALGSLAKKCRCEVAPVAELAVRRYPMTREDLVLKRRRYAEVCEIDHPEPISGRRSGRGGRGD